MSGKNVCHRNFVTNRHSWAVYNLGNAGLGWAELR